MIPEAATIACAAPGCDTPVPQHSGPGRPALYCSSGCRPSHRQAGVVGVVVEVEHPDVSPDGRPSDRVWVVRLRRGPKVVVIANDLGWPSATALAGQLHDLLFDRRKQKGGAIE